MWETHSCAMAEAVARSASSNNFAEHVSVSIQRAMLGKDIILRNEKDNARRVQVIHCSESAGNVSVGDVFFAVDGHPLPLRTNAVELEDTRGSRRPRPPVLASTVLFFFRADRLEVVVRASFRLNPQPSDGRELPKMVHLSLWRTTPEAFLGIGTEVAIVCKSAKTLGVKWKQIRLKTKDVDMYPQAALINTLYTACDVVDATSPSTVAIGDILVGVNHTPLPESLGLDDFHRFVRDHKGALGGGPPTLNLIRVTNPAVRKIVMCGAPASVPPRAHARRETGRLPPPRFRSGLGVAAQCGGCNDLSAPGCLGQPRATTGPDALFQARPAPAPPDGGARPR